MSHHEIIFFIIIWIIAGFLNGMTSFGALMLAIPVLTFIMGTKEAIILGCVTSLAITTPIVIRYFKWLPVREFLCILISCIIGLPIGIFILNYANSKILLFGSAFILILFICWQIYSVYFKLNIIIAWWYIIVAGFLSGVSMGATGLSGPIVAMYAVIKKWSKETALVVINAMCLLATFFFIFIQFKNGVLTEDIIKKSFIAMPATIFGVLVSFPLIKRINNSFFYILLLGMLAVSFIILIIRGIAL